MSTVTNNTSTPSAASSTASSQASLNTDYQNFLTLLTTQLQNQDPTSPLDTNQLTAQIAALSQVEQQINSNSKLDQLISLFSANQTSTAASYIGAQVDATGNQVDLLNSKATIVYDLPANATNATVTITNSAGATVYSAPGTTIDGRNQIQWDGNTTSGTTAPDGAYTYTVTATDSSGNPVTATTFTTGVVTAVDSANGTDSLALGSLSVPLSSVQSVYPAGTNPGA